MRKKGFTLLEILIAITGFFLLMTLVMTSYMQIIKYRYAFQARSSLVESTYYMMEKINLLLKDYTIDYEEYFNRSSVGCSGQLISHDFAWNVGTLGYCQEFTSYGNQNPDPDISIHERHDLYYCSSVASSIGVFDAGVVKYDPDIGFGSGCFFGYGVGEFPTQSYGEYALQFLDVQDDVDSVDGPIGDSDDKKFGKGPLAIYDSTGVQELYLISQDKTSRIFLRRALVESGDWNGDGVISGDNESRYTIQILKLKAFDAGTRHNFDYIGSVGVYDGKTDTWACDFAQGFVCHGAAIDAGLYPGYALPSDANDGWVNLFDRNITVTDWNLMVYPTKDPSLAWNEDPIQMNPYFVISLTSKLYGGVWQKRLSESTQYFSFSLQSTFSTKNNYLN